MKRFVQFHSEIEKENLGCSMLKKKNILQVK